MEQPEVLVLLRKKWPLGKRYIFTRNGNTLQSSIYKYFIHLEFIDEPEPNPEPYIEIAELRGIMSSPPMSSIAGSTIDGLDAVTLPLNSPEQLQDPDGRLLQGYQQLRGNDFSWIRRTASAASQHSYRMHRSPPSTTGDQGTGPAAMTTPISSANIAAYNSEHPGSAGSNNSTTYQFPVLTPSVAGSTVGPHNIRPQHPPPYSGNINTASASRVTPKPPAPPAYAHSSAKNTKAAGGHRRASSLWQPSASLIREEDEYEKDGEEAGERMSDILSQKNPRRSHSPTALTSRDNAEDDYSILKRAANQGQSFVDKIKRRLSTTISGIRGNISNVMTTTPTNTPISKGRTSSDGGGRAIKVRKGATNPNSMASQSIIDDSGSNRYDYRLQSDISQSEGLHLQLPEIQTTKQPYITMPDMPESHGTATPAPTNNQQSARGREKERKQSDVSIASSHTNDYKGKSPDRASIISTNVRANTAATTITTSRDAGDTISIASSQVSSTRPLASSITVDSGAGGLKRKSAMGRVVTGTPRSVRDRIADYNSLSANAAENESTESLNKSAKKRTKTMLSNSSTASHNSSNIRMLGQSHKENSSLTNVSGTNNDKASNVASVRTAVEAIEEKVQAESSASTSTQSNSNVKSKSLLFGKRVINRLVGKKAK
ncbi:hypothetical protein H4219_003098 [Mycoemilia scoparia]|uniref:Uncharacterized protein n=1 Tax=Mycoemilia scoparia TaxID=417184 RepID=A0A9W7ZVU8_9FUNG|nr:hypothetical protein H4219_003098 [Mycoemilia scoparia]